MTSKIVVNNIEADTGISTVTFNSNIQGNLIGNVTGNVNTTGVSTFSNIRVTGGTISGVSTAGITTAYIGSVNDGPISGARNRIINGDMRIDQRNAGAAVSTDGAFPVDRFLASFSTDGAFSAQQNSSAPAGFNSSIRWTTTTADATLGATQYALLRQKIEGLNTYDLGFGSATAKAVTLSFWVRSSLTGNFGGSITNSAQNRCYPFSYNISSPDTWEYKTLTIPGDTTGTWLTTNGIGLDVFWGLGVGSTYSGTAGSWSSTSNLYSFSGAVSVIGTLNATFYITGVQLESGTVATPFERRSYGQELALAQRYYYRVDAVDFGGGGPIFGSGSNNNTTTSMIWTPFAVPMRTSPSSIDTTGTASNYSVIHANTSTTCSSVPVIDDRNRYGCRINLTVASGLTAGQGSFGRLATTGTSYIGFNAEL